MKDKVVENNWNAMSKRSGAIVCIIVSATILFLELWLYPSKESFIIPQLPIKSGFAFLLFIASPIFGIFGMVLYARDLPKPGSSSALKAKTYVGLILIGLLVLICIMRILFFLLLLWVYGPSFSGH